MSQQITEATNDSAGIPHCRTELQIPLPPYGEPLVGTEEELRIFVDLIFSEVERWHGENMAWQAPAAIIIPSMFPHRIYGTVHGLEILARHLLVTLDRYDARRERWGIGNEPPRKQNGWWRRAGGGRREAQGPPTDLQTGLLYYNDPKRSAGLLSSAARVPSPAYPATFRVSPEEHTYYGRIWTPDVGSVSGWSDDDPAKDDFLTMAHGQIVVASAKIAVGNLLLLGRDEILAVRWGGPWRSRTPKLPCPSPSCFVPATDLNLWVELVERQIQGTPASDPFYALD